MGKLTQYEVWDRIGGNIVERLDPEEYSIIGIVDGHPVKLVPEPIPKIDHYPVSNRFGAPKPAPKPSSTKKTRGKKNVDSD